MTTELFHSKVKGTSFYNVPFSLIHPDDPLTWKRDPQNPYDPNAISLWWEGQQVGHLGADLAKDLAPGLDEGRLGLAVVVTEVTGGEQLEIIPGMLPPSKPKNRGINIQITVTYHEQALVDALAFPGETPTEVQSPGNIFDTLYD